MSVEALKFEHGGLAYKRAERLSGEDGKRVSETVGMINQLMAANAEIFESKKGVRQVYTHVSALELIAHLTVDKDLRQKAQEALEKRKEMKDEDKGVNQNVFALCSSAPNKAIKTDGGFTTASDVGYRELLKSLKGVTRQLKENDGIQPVRDFEVVFMASPFNPGGKTTTEYNEKLKDDAFSALGELNSELIASKYPKAEKLIVVGGVSFGAVIALRMARFLPEDLKKKTRVWAANPDPVYGEAAPKKGNWLTMALGVATNFYDVMTRWQHYASKRTIEAEYDQVLEDMRKRGIDVCGTDDPAQQDLKNKGLDLILKNVAQGSDRIDCRLYPPEVKVVLIQGAFDLSSQSLGETALAMIRLLWPKLGLLGLGVKTDESRMIRQFKVRAGHPVDLHKVKKWARQVKCLYEPGALQS